MKFPTNFLYMNKIHRNAFRRKLFIEKLKFAINMSHKPISEKIYFVEMLFYEFYEGFFKTLDIFECF